MVAWPDATKLATILFCGDKKVPKHHLQELGNEIGYKHAQGCFLEMKVSFMVQEFIYN
jgi:hypothetical protein